MLDVNVRVWMKAGAIPVGSYPLALLTDADWRPGDVDMLCPKGWNTDHRLADRTSDGIPIVPMTTKGDLVKVLTERFDLKACQVFLDPVTKKPVTLYPSCKDDILARRLTWNEEAIRNDGWIHDPWRVMKYTLRGYRMTETEYRKRHPKPTQREGVLDLSPLPEKVAHSADEIWDIPF